MRIPRAVLVAVAVVAVVLAPTAGAAQQPSSAAIPEIRVQGADEPLLQTSFGTVTFTVDRPAYAAVFELARDGRVRVLSPSRPSDTTRVQPGRRQWAKAWSPDLLMLPAVSLDQTLDDPVPFVFVVTSDRPLDLSAFGKGKRWARQLMPPDPHARPDVIVATIVDRVIATDASYDWDYAYLAPSLTARQQIVLMQCSSPGEFRQNDFWAYHALWGLATTGWFGYPRAGLFYTTYYSPAFGAPPWFQTFGSCYTGPRLPTYVVLPRSIDRVAYAPRMRPPTDPAPPAPADTAHTPEPSAPSGRGPQRPLDAIPSDAPVRTGDWREAASREASVARRPTPRTSVPGGQQPKDPLPTLDERRAQWKAERLAQQPTHADEALAARTNEIARMIRSRGLAARLDGSYVAADRNSRSTQGERRDYVVEKGSGNAAGRDAGERQTSSGARSAEGSAGSIVATTPRAEGASASSAAQANAPGRASGDQPRRVQ